MAEVFRNAVLKAITAQIKSVTPANGFEHDLSDFADAAGRNQERVFRGRTQFGSNDPIPMVSILEDPRALEANNGSGSSQQAMNTFKLLIQGFVKDDAENPLDPAYALSAEVVLALAAAKKQPHNILGFGHKAPCITGISIGQPVHRPGGDDVSEVAYFLIGVTLTLAEVLDRPTIGTTPALTFDPIEHLSLVGESAYQVAVRNGFVGTEVEWLASLNGAGGSSVSISTDENQALTLGSDGGLFVETFQTADIPDINLNFENALL